jgi:hypothetical protein
MNLSGAFFSWHPARRGRVDELHAIALRSLDGCSRRSGPMAGTRDQCAYRPRRNPQCLPPLNSPLRRQPRPPGRNSPKTVSSPPRKSPGSPMSRSAPCTIGSLTGPFRGPRGSGGNSGGIRPSSKNGSPSRGYEPCSKLARFVSVPRSRIRAGFISALRVRSFSPCGLRLANPLKQERDER